MRIHKILLLFILLICSGKLSFAQFQDIAPNMGITTGYGLAGFGGGISFCDFNGDGLDDLTLATKTGAPIRFFQNMNGSLVEIPPLVPNTDEVRQLIWVDYDNDGDKDLFLAIYNNFNRLYQNDGNMNLTDVTIAAQIPILTNLSFGASFGDYNNDGWLDLYISNYESDDTGTSTSGNYLLKNNQDGTFSDVTNPMMMNYGNTLSFGTAFLDYNNDTQPDLYIFEDKSNRNFCYQNNNGTFSEEGSINGSGIIMDAMNVGVGDYDNDGDLDIYITNSTPGVTSSPHQGNALLQNNNGMFTEGAASAGVSMNQWSWGANWLDFDNDQDLDLYVCSTEDNTFNRLYENQGNGTFTEPYPMGLPNDDTYTTSTAIGDFNNDGLMDMAVCGILNDPFMIWENIGSSTNNWIKVALEGVQSNKDGIGVWIETTCNNRTQYRYTLCGESFMAQNTLNHHIGIGLNNLIDEIILKWPSGIRDTINNILPNQRIVIQEGIGLISGNVQACASNLHVNSPTDNSTYIADQILISDAIIPTGFMIQFQAGDCIELQADFEVELGATFETMMQGCL